MSEPQFPDATESMNQAMSLDGNAETLAQFYAEWADSYDEDIADDYQSPGMIVRTLAEAIDVDDALVWAIDPHVQILDVGCGTGLTGRALADAGYLTIDGVDLSPEMVEVARKTGVYRGLTGGFDINRAVSMRMASAYDIVTIAGVLTVGHVPPAALANVAKLARPGGLLIASTRQAYYDSTNYQQVSDSLISGGVLKLVHQIRDAPYTMDSTAHYWAYRVER